MGKSKTKIAYEQLIKIFSKFSIEFSLFLSIIFTLLGMGFIDLWLVKILLGVAVIVFFCALMGKFGIEVYKKYYISFIELDKCAKNAKKEKETITP